LRLVALAVLSLAGCPAQPPACTTVDTTTCQELYEPTWDNVYSMTIAVSCGSDRSACHSDSGRSGGMTFANKDTSYTELLDGRRVKPGDPGCSLMVVRIEGVGTDYQMPQGDPLSAPERCAIAKWVEAGAAQ
jgi:hypothetical protein